MRARVYTRDRCARTHACAHTRVRTRVHIHTRDTCARTHGQPAYVFWTRRRIQSGYVAKCLKKTFAPNYLLNRHLQKYLQSFLSVRLFISFGWCMFALPTCHTWHLTHNRLITRAKYFSNVKRNVEPTHK